MVRTGMRSLTLPLITAALLLAGCATNPVTGRSDFVTMSEQDEIKLGQQVNQQVLQQYHIYNDPELQSYVQHVGQKLAANSHRSHLKYHFTVLDSDEVNAFALPGGYVFITRGIMAYLNSEAELAAVLGHEIGHVTARHAVRQQSASQIANIGIALGSLFLPGGYQNVGQQLGGVLGGALLSGYGRDHELESDRLGAEYLSRTNYNPEAMLDVIRVLKNQESFELKMARAENRKPRVYHGLFASHPDNDTRLQEVVRSVDRVTPVKSPNIGRADYLAHVDEMVFGENPQMGITRGRNFYHGDMDFALQFPEGWSILNRPAVLAGMAPNQNAMVQLFAEPADKSLTPREFMIKKLKLEQLRDEQDRKINGLPAHSAAVVVQSGTNRQSARITVIYHRNTAFILAGLTRNPGDFLNYDSTFKATAQTFRRLTGEEQASIKPRLIKLITANDRTDYKTLTLASPLEKYPEEQLRLLNSDYPKGEIEPGERLKIVD